VLSILIRASLLWIEIDALVLTTVHALSSEVLTILLLRFSSSCLPSLEGLWSVSNVWKISGRCRSLGRISEVDLKSKAHCSHLVSDPGLVLRKRVLVPNSLGTTHEQNRSDFACECRQVIAYSNADNTRSTVASELANHPSNILFQKHVVGFDF